MKDKNIVKLEINAIIQGNMKMLHIAYVIQNIVYLKKSIVFHNGVSYDHHFIIEVFAKELKKQSTCLGENTEKYITFTVLIEKEVTVIYKNEEEVTRNISYILKFIDSARFTASSLSNFINNLSERGHNKYGYNDKKMWNLQN